MAQGRLIALALVTGTLVASGVGPASAATTGTTERVYAASGAGSVLRIEINLPAAVPGLLPRHIVQDVVLADGAARSGASPVAVANAYLGRGGNVGPLQGRLDGKAQASLRRRSDSYALASTPGNPLGLTGAALSAVSRAGSPDADGPVSTSTASLASLQLTGAGALGSVLASLQAVLDQALGATTGATASGSPAAPVTTTVSEVLGTVLTTLDGVTSGATTPVSDAVKDAVAQVTAAINTLLADLAAQVGALSATDALLDVGRVRATQTITRAGQTVTSSVVDELAGIDVLGGLVKVGGIRSSAVASLGGRTSSSSATATVLMAQVGDVVSLDVADGLRTLLGGPVGGLLPADVLAQVTAALAQVTDLLASTLGLQAPVQATTSKSATADRASAAVTPASLVLDPFKSGTAPLLRLGFAPAQATVEARTLTRTVTTAAPASLPRTGGSAPLALAGTALLGVALVAHRRRTATP